MSTKAAEKKTDALPQKGADPEVEMPEQSDKHWIWKDGDWVEAGIPTASDADFLTMMRQMPATSWSLLASAFDQAGFRPTQSEDVRHIKEFLVGVTRHPNFQGVLKTAMQKRAQG